MPPVASGLFQAAHPALTAAQARGRADARVRALFEGGFAYSRRLAAHTSCVNVLAVAADGRWLASAGDDRHVLLWDFHQPDLQSPSYAFVGLKSNVFALEFSAMSRYLYAGDTDGLIVKYDVETSSVMASRPYPHNGSPSAIFGHHTDSVRAITSHPTQDEVFMSASEDGRIVLHDGRDGASMTRAQGTIQSEWEYSSVRWNPAMEHVFASSDVKGNVCLRDVRMAFGPRTSRTQEGVVMTYATRLRKPSTSRIASPEPISLVFDGEGNRLAVMFQNYLPTIYATSDSRPFATCSGRNRPDGTPVPAGERTFALSSTIKHGSFGGPSHDYFASGSNDFRGYVWKLPSSSYLAERRKESPDYDRLSQGPGPPFWFTTAHDAPHYLPMELSTPLFRLSGHRSIVNAVAVHPQHLHIVTAGVERTIILHSPTPSTPCADALTVTDTAVRALPPSNAADDSRYIRALLGHSSTVPGDATRSQAAADEHLDAETILLFDEVLRREEALSPFSSREWRAAQSNSASDAEDQ